MLIINLKNGGKRESGFSKSKAHLFQITAPIKQVFEVPLYKKYCECIFSDLN